MTPSVYLLLFVLPCAEVDAQQACDDSQAGTCPDLAEHGTVLLQNAVSMHTSMDIKLAQGSSGLSISWLKESALREASLSNEANQSSKDLFRRELEKPLFDYVPNESWESVERPSGYNGVAMMHYHKTGCAISYHFGHIMQEHGWNFTPKKNSTRVKLSKGVVSSSSFLQGAFKGGGNKSFTVVTNPASDLRLESGSRVVHWYRDPMSFIVSGYRYHASNAETWENALTTAPRIDDEIGRALFSSCNFSCGYFGLLDRQDKEEAGVDIEGVMERPTLQAMQTNLQRWSDNPQVLHVTMEHLTADFNATLRCILSFMGVSNETSEKLIVPLQALDANSKAMENSKHVTTGKYDNTGLGLYLSNHSSWGTQFARARKFAAPIYKRQHEMFGCPHVEYSTGASFISMDAHD